MSTCVICFPLSSFLLFRFHWGTYHSNTQLGPLLGIVVLDYTGLLGFLHRRLQREEKRSIRAGKRLIIPISTRDLPNGKRHLTAVRRRLAGHAGSTAGRRVELRRHCGGHTLSK